MSGIKLQKRENDFFISYGHRGLARVLPLIDLLKGSCGLKIWFDSADGNASERSSELLGGAIGNSRGNSMNPVGFPIDRGPRKQTQ